MQTCRACGTEWPDETVTCEQCGADLATRTAEPAIATNADFDQQAERERFQARYGIDIGERTVDEYLQYIARQDYSLTTWFWAIVGVEVVLVGLLAYALIGSGGWEVLPVLLGLSILLSAAIYADTKLVGLFEQWSAIRWLYILLSLVPFSGQIAAFLYLVLRRLKREQTERERRRLFESGFDLEANPGQD